MTPLTRLEAIERLARGEKCETLLNSVSGWRRTWWSDFDRDDHTFRIPPEPRREAQEFWLVGTSDLPIKVWAHEPSMIQPNEVWRKRVREVLPDAVVLRKMTEAEIHNLLANHGSWYDVIRALDLIREDRT